MADKEWLIASNLKTMFALPKNNLAEVLTGKEIIPLPFGSDRISGIFLHKGKVMPLLKDENIGFAGTGCDLLLIESGGDSLAVPVTRIAGFVAGALEEELQGQVHEPFRGQVDFEGKKVPVLEVEELYKQLGFI